MSRRRRSGTLSHVPRKGLEIESLRSLVAGGIAFATPEADSPPARDDTIFVLHDKPQKEWLTWAPKIPIPPGD